MLARWLIALAPRRLRETLKGEGLVTLSDVCREAREKGAWRAAGVLLAELFDLARAIARAWAGRQLPITAGRPPVPRPPHQESRMRRLIPDLRHAVRSLVASRGTAAIAVATLAIGLGVNTTVFSILDSLLFRPVPYAEASRLRELWSYYPPGKFSMQGQFTAPLVALWRTQTDLFDRVEATQRKSLVLDVGGAEMVRGSMVTPGLMSMLGVPAERGRVFMDGDGRDGTDHRVVVSHGFWRRRLGSDPAAIARQLTLDAERYEIVGIMPATFRFPSETDELWIPIDVEQPPSRSLAAPTTTKGMSVVANVKFTGVVRLKEGMTHDIAHQMALARGSELERRAGGDGSTSASLMVMGEVFDERTGRSLWVLGGAVVFLLLIVCANVANLTLARSVARTRDLAVRAALGASRRDLFGAVFLEHLLLGAAGATLGAGLAYIGIAAANSVLPQSMTAASLNVIDLDWRTLGFLAAVSLGTVLLSGTAPAVVASRASIATVLSRQSRSAAGSRATGRLRGALVVVEVALSIILLVGAALMTRSLIKLQAIDVGMDVEGLVTARLALPTPAYADPTARDLFTERVVGALRARPGVRHASAGALPPDEGDSISVGTLEFADRPPTPNAKRSLLYVYRVWPGYFQAAGIPIIEGREPAQRDVEGAAVVSKDFASRHWPNRSPVGARFRVGNNPWRTVVGVAGEVRRLGEDEKTQRPEIYYPHDQFSGTMTKSEPSSTIAEYLSLVIRTDSPGEIMKDLSRTVHEVDSLAIVSGAKLVSTQFSDSIARPRILFLTMTIFAAVGLLLAAAGLYGVLSYVLSLRLREIGVRLALGASPAGVGALIIRNGLTLVLAGVVIGVAGAMALVSVMRTLLYQVEPTDPMSVGSSRVDLQACKLEYSIVSPK